jgi:hypothetical protein
MGDPSRPLPGPPVGCSPPTHLVASGDTVVAMRSRPLGKIEIVEMLGMDDRTVHTWTQRGALPEADGPMVHGMPTWERTTILEWAGDTGRLGAPGQPPPKGARIDLGESEALRAEYARLFGRVSAPWNLGGRKAGEPRRRVRRDADDKTA